MRLLAAATALLALVLAGCGGSHRAPVAGQGRVVQGSLHSSALRGTLHYQAYLPPGYGSRRTRYPVIYALHGLPSDASGYRQMDVADWGRAAQRAGRPAIVVAPQGARAGDTDPEWHDWGPGRDWETATADELVRHVDASFRTIRDRRGRAIVGVSAGGYGASIIGVKHPGTYSVVQSWSGYFHPTDPAGDAPLELGSPDADDAASVHSYLSDVKRFFSDDVAGYFGFFVGDADPHFVPENEQLHAELRRAGVRHAFAVYPGAHSNAFWRAHQDEWIAAAVDHLDPPA